MAGASDVKKGKSVKVIRHVYLYLVAMIGLITFVMGAVGIINNGLQHYVFNVDGFDKFAVPASTGSMDPCSMSLPNPTDKTGKATVTPTTQQIADCRVNLEKQRIIDQEQRNRYSDVEFGRQVSISLAQILIGLPIWLFHWGVIQSENRRKEDN